MCMKFMRKYRLDFFRSRSHFSRKVVSREGMDDEVHYAGMFVNLMWLILNNSTFFFTPSLFDHGIRYAPVSPDPDPNTFVEWTDLERKDRFLHAVYKDQAKQMYKECCPSCTPVCDKFEIKYSEKPLSCVQGENRQNHDFKDENKHIYY
ncbi:hypothetical protein X798_01873 [Onchocerca flexuosa]|uniref:Uncharacterized protein n=1 Tax=Onchocerca flexuosa TaxID=387005 RepID=A0A238C0L5_9BILA|nr:hypothetical protein X798_01873 [Onchocerca flexuosa]